MTEYYVINDLFEEFTLDFFWDFSFLIIPIICITAFLALAYTIHYLRLYLLNDDRLPIAEHILLLIAHPDDEAMFFTPTINELVRYNILHILCLSNGDYYGLGKLRERELLLSCKRFGITEFECVKNQKLKDGKKWNPEDVKEEVKNYLTKKKNYQVITKIFTFDGYGVSGHSNHIAAHVGALMCLHNEEDFTEFRNLKKVYCLDSVSILRKFTSFIDTAFSCIGSSASETFLKLHPFDAQWHLEMH